MCIKSFIFMYISTVFQDFCTKVRIYSLLISNFKLWFLGVVHSAQSGYIPRVWCITESNSKSVCPFKLCLGQNFPSFGYICITNSFPWSKDKWWPWSKVISTRTRTQSTNNGIKCPDHNSFLSYWIYIFNFPLVNIVTFWFIEVSTQWPDYIKQITKGSLTT